MSQQQVKEIQRIAQSNQRNGIPLDTTGHLTSWRDALGLYAQLPPDEQRLVQPAFGADTDTLNRYGVWAQKPEMLASDDMMKHYRALAGTLSHSDQLAELEDWRRNADAKPAERQHVAQADYLESLMTGNVPPDQVHPALIDSVALLRREQSQGVTPGGEGSVFQYKGELPYREAHFNQWLKTTQEAHVQMMDRGLIAAPPDPASNAAPDLPDPETPAESVAAESDNISPSDPEAIILYQTVFNPVRDVSNGQISGYRVAPGNGNDPSGVTPGRGGSSMVDAQSVWDLRDHNIVSSPFMAEALSRQLNENGMDHPAGCPLRAFYDHFGPIMDQWRQNTGNTTTYAHMTEFRQVVENARMAPPYDLNAPGQVQQQPYTQAQQQQQQQQTNVFDPAAGSGDMYDPNPHANDTTRMSEAEQEASQDGFHSLHEPSGEDPLAAELEAQNAAAKTQQEDEEKARQDAAKGQQGGGGRAGLLSGLFSGLNRPTAHAPTGSEHQQPQNLTPGMARDALVGAVNSAQSAMNDYIINPSGAQHERMRNSLDRVRNLSDHHLHELDGDTMQRVAQGIQKMQQQAAAHPEAKGFSKELEELSRRIGEAIARFFARFTGGGPPTGGSPGGPA
jgi:hypothetical protein